MTSVTRQATEPALQGLFDHAGMFPPASLALDAAVADAARFPTTLHRPGLVGADLVVAWKDWPQLPAALAKAHLKGPARVAVVGVALADGPAVARQLAGAKAARVVSLEVHVEGAVDAALVRATVADAGAVPVFVEPKWAPAQLAGEAPAVAALLKAAKAGLKVRCAGPTAVDRAALAAVLDAVADAGIPFKATQGLHHPFPRPGFPHGFLGLLAALRLRQAQGTAFAPEVIDCLAETDSVAFDFSDGIAWRGEQVTAAELARLPPFAIGSCSLTEPDEDLAHAYGDP